MRHALTAALLATSMFSLPTAAHAQAMTAEAFGKQVTSDYHQWGKIVRDAGVKIE